MTACCAACRLDRHAPWCPMVSAARDANRPAQPLATEDWARGVLVALGVEETPEAVATVREALTALHRSANAEGLAFARAHVPDVPRSPDDAKDAHQDLLAAVSATLADRHAELLAVGVETTPGEPEAAAPAVRADAFLTNSGLAAAPADEPAGAATPS